MVSCNLSMLTLFYLEHPLCPSLDCGGTAASLLAKNAVSYWKWGEVVRELYIALFFHGLHTFFTHQNMYVGATYDLLQAFEPNLFSN